jgi:hypothetical protein
LVRPFHPQLTRTFVKSASDPVAISVRNRAAAGLGALMKHQVSILLELGRPLLICRQPRVDPLITELIGGIRAGDGEIAPSMAGALAAVCASAGNNIGAAARASIIELVEEAFTAGRKGVLDTVHGGGYTDAKQKTTIKRSARWSRVWRLMTQSPSGRLSSEWSIPASPSTADLAPVPSSLRPPLPRQWSRPSSWP